MQISVYYYNDSFYLFYLIGELKLIMDDPDPATAIIWKLVLLLLLIIVNAFFAMSEIAIISLNDNKLRVMADDGHEKAKKVLKLVESPSAFLSTIQIGVTLAGFLTSASAAQSFSEPIAKWIASVCGLATIPTWLNGVSTIVVTVIMSYFSLVLGELAPKRIAMQCSEKISFKVVGILLFIKSAMKPFVTFLSFSTNIIVRIFGFDPNADEEVVTEEEIRMMVDAGEEKGVIEESQKEMINNIFEFDDIVAADVMTHRTDLECVEIGDSIETVIKISMSKGYSRIPVYEDEIDNIRGIIYVKDLLKYIGKSVPESFKISRIMREATFIPESKRCGDLFNEMTEKHLQMVIVSDEYGSTAGIVTIEDLLESIVGNMQDEYDNEEEEIEQVSDNIYNFDGLTDIEEVNEVLSIQIPDGEYDTLGGFIMSELGRIPEADEKPVVCAEGFQFTVEEMEERRIEKVRAERLPEDEVSQEDTEKSK